MNKIWLVAKETYRREVKTWSYLLMILAPFLLVFFSFVIGMVSAGGSDDNYVGVVTSNSASKQAIKKSEDFDNYSTEAKAKKAYKDEDIDGYVLIEQKNNQSTRKICQITAQSHTDSNTCRSKKSSKRGRNRKQGSKSVTIKNGDTLSEIAARHGTTVKKLRKLNGIKGNSIRAGKKIKVK